jgi:hypothetical protein
MTDEQITQLQQNLMDAFVVIGRQQVELMRAQQVMQQQQQAMFEMQQLYEGGNADADGHRAGSRDQLRQPELPREP